MGKADPGVRWPLIRELFWLALPMGLVMALISLNSNIPRYFIERWFGTESLGVFSAAAYLVVAGNMVLFALCQSASPRLARYFRAGELGSFRRLIGRMLLLSVVLGGLGIAFALLAGAAALRILYGPAYAEHGMLLTWLMVAAAVGYVGSAIGFGMTAARRLRSQLPIFAGAAAVSAAACYVFIPRYGLNGAAYALLGAAMVQVAAGAGVLYSAIRKAAVGEIRP